MIRLLYISTTRTPLPAADVDAILRASRRNNKACGVTGLLVVGGRRFLQVLEGPEEAVIATFERIRSDPRHFAVVVLNKATIVTRSFGDWAMGLQPSGTLQHDAPIAVDVDAMIESIDDANIRANFAQFARQHAGRVAA